MSLLPNCDYCGRFHNPKAKGASSFFIPSSDVSYELLLHRCPKCTRKYGPPEVSMYKLIIQ